MCEHKNPSVLRDLILGIKVWVKTPPCCIFRSSSCPLKHQCTLTYTFIVIVFIIMFKSKIYDTFICYVLRDAAYLILPFPHPHWWWLYARSKVHSWVCYKIEYSFTREYCLSNLGFMATVRSTKGVSAALLLVVLTSVFNTNPVDASGYLGRK